MTEDAYAFVSGPRMVETFTGESLDATELGGAGIHAPSTGRRGPGGRRRRRRPTGALSTCSPTCPSVIDEEPPTLVDRRSRRPADPRGRRLHPRLPHRRLRRARRRPRASSTTATCSSCARTGRPTSSPAFATIGGRPVGDRRQPADVDRRHARHPRLAEGRPVRGLLRRLRPPAAHPRRHAGLLPGQGPRVAGDDPPRRPARLRLRPGHGAPGGGRAAQGLRRRLHRHGLPHAWATTSTWPGRRPRSR